MGRAIIPPGSALRGMMVDYEGATMNAEQLATLIRAAVPGDVEVRSDDDVHFSARVVSPAFAGLRQLARHQLVYKALGDRMGGEIHALSIEAQTPEERASGRK